MLKRGDCDCGLHEAMASGVGRVSMLSFRHFWVSISWTLGLWYRPHLLHSVVWFARIIGVEVQLSMGMRLKVIKMCRICFQFYQTLFKRAGVVSLRRP